MMVQESRILQVCLFETIQRNLGTVDFSLVLSDIMLIADEVDSQLTQSVESFFEIAERDRRLSFRLRLPTTQGNATLEIRNICRCLCQTFPYSRSSTPDRQPCSEAAGCINWDSQAQSLQVPAPLPDFDSAPVFRNPTRNRA